MRKRCETPDDLPLPAELLQKLEEEHMVRVAMDQLGERCRTLLTLLYFQETPPAYDGDCRCARDSDGQYRPVPSPVPAAAPRISCWRAGSE